MQPDFSMRSWVTVPPDSDFPIQNIPFGVGKLPDGRTVACSRIGDKVVDLAGLFAANLLPIQGLHRPMFEAKSLNMLISAGKEATSALRQAIIALLRDDAGAQIREQVNQCLFPADAVEMRLPVEVGNYTDFYSSEEHAKNVGSMFRDPANALLPNWKHMPVGYHGRASSIVVSGTDIKRPWGQVMPPDAAQPVFSPTRLLDFELEMGFVVGGNTRIGDRLSTDRAEDFIFGLLLFNDWSARDIQKWEYVPLGPFLGKNFASSVSPWIVTLEALEPFRVEGPAQDPAVLPYLKFTGKRNFNIHLEVWLRNAMGSETRLCESNFSYMYWNMAQQLAHHTVNGCNICVGDIYASGTISGPEAGSYGSMLELSWRGTKPLKLSDGTERKFLEDGDTVIMKGWADRHGVKIGFGEVRGKILPG